MKEGGSKGGGRSQVQSSLCLIRFVFRGKAEYTTISEFPTPCQRHDIRRVNGSLDSLEAGDVVPINIFEGCAEYRVVSVQRRVGEVLAVCSGHRLEVGSTGGCSALEQFVLSLGGPDVVDVQREVAPAARGRVCGRRGVVGQKRLKEGLDIVRDERATFQAELSTDNLSFTYTLAVRFQMSVENRLALVSFKTASTTVGVNCSNETVLKIPL